MHHLLIPIPVTNEFPVSIYLLPCPFLLPCRFSVLIYGIHLTQENTFGIGDVIEYGVLGNQVADHDETAAAYIERTEEGRLYPGCKFTNSFFVLAELIVIKVIDDDVIRAGFPITETSGTLTATACQELDTAVRLEFSVGPVSSGRLLFSEVALEAIVVLQFCLDITKEAAGGILTLADYHHEVYQA